MEQSDEDLVRRSREGDDLAFKELVIRHQRAVAGVVQSMLGATQEAEDVGQEVFIRFYQSLDKFKGESALSTYLIRIGINLSLNELKKRKRQPRYMGREDEAQWVKAEDDNRDLRDVVKYEIGRLDPEFQSVVTLRMIEGYTTEETAELLGIPLGTVLSRLSRAQKKLKTVLSKHLGL